jgi:hypothetical protein
MLLSEGRPVCAGNRITLSQVEREEHRKSGLRSLIFLTNIRIGSIRVGLTFCQSLPIHLANGHHRTIPLGPIRVISGRLVPSVARHGPAMTAQIRGLSPMVIYPWIERGCRRCLLELIGLLNMITSQTLRKSVFHQSRMASHFVVPATHFLPRTLPIRR